MKEGFIFEELTNLTDTPKEAKCPKRGIQTIMAKFIDFEIDKKQIRLFKNDNENVPIVYANMFQDAGHEVLEACEKLGCSPFHLVAITNLRWNEELLPWPHEPVITKSDRFTGEATSYAHCLTKDIIPHVEKTMKKPPLRIIAGYSMGGLFALYAPYITDAFLSVVSASGSVWYPNFVSYVKEHDFLRKPESIYLSIGDLESRTKDPFFSQTEHCTKELHSIYQRKAVESIFELNPGNHYKDAPYRLAKGIAWTLES